MNGTGLPQFPCAAAHGIERTAYALQDDGVRDERQRVGDNGRRRLSPEEFHALSQMGVSRVEMDLLKKARPSAQRDKLVGLLQKARALIRGYVPVTPVIVQIYVRGNEGQAAELERATRALAESVGIGSSFRAPVDGDGQ